MNTYGSDAGTMIFVSILKRESRSTRPTFRWSGLIDRTPTAVLITVGHIAQSAIVNTAAGSDFWKITRPSGSQASGEICRRNWMIGSNAWWNARDRPSRKPSGVPIASASRKPLPTRTSE